MKLLMHTCCAPCSVYCIDELRSRGIEPTLYWYNPNIHPYTEYMARRDCVKEYAQKINVKKPYLKMSMDLMNFAKMYQKILMPDV